MSESAEVSDGNRSRERGVVQSFRRIALEIVIGFVGVYAAFALSAYKDRQDQVERRHLIKRALLSEIRPMPALMRSNAGFYREILAQWDSAVAKGEKKSPRPFFQAIGIENHAWEATKQSGGLQLLDAPTFFLLSEYYSDWNNMVAQYGQLRDFSLTEIYPGLDRGVNSFFEPGTSKPRQIFAVYRWDLRQLARVSDLLATRGDSLIKILSKDTI